MKKGGQMIEELELKIVRSLNKNSRKSFREIAKEIGTSAPVVINKIKRLEEQGAIKGYIPILDPEYFGFNLIAIVGIRISDGKLIETQEKIAEDSHVFAIYDVTGEWDSIVIAHFKSRDDLNSFIKNVLSQKYVDRTVTHIVLNVVKDERRIVI
ncbi:MAG TPA: Lrp/AsnC family transcriptional regulator [Candidatus Aminicenantes bacterium]|jgi:DNA-binding Lrp family transcriptional regulator|nr:Lrp/AsnC family transcriptional regulator [Candidatus Aminicenantes bacterium]HEB34253.1 Lrp/AsnC family transcriptional regulator [Candidatus Aminicenantes bacterium]